MLARNSIRRSMMVSAVPAAFRVTPNSSTTTSARKPISVVAPASTSLVASQRNFSLSLFAGNLAQHCTQLTACASASAVLYSPLGTLMYVVLAYNVVVIGTKHVNYSMEITAKDYVQDQQLYVIMRYGILACILLGMEVMFIEI